MSKDQLTLRTIAPADRAAVIGIANRAFANARKFTRAELGDKLADLAFPGGDDRSKGLEVASFLDKTPTQAIVAECGGRIVGFATWHVDGKLGTIGNNGADPDDHVPGTGTAMYRELLRIFRAKGCAGARVTTGLSEPFAPARKTYQKAGFRLGIESVTYYLDLDEPETPAPAADSGLTLRPIAPADHETVFDIAERAFANTRREKLAILGGKLMDLFFPGDEAHSKRQVIGKFLADNPGQAVVAEHDGRIVGFADWRLQGSFGIISYNGADPDRHVRGTGTALYRELLRIFRAKGCPAARVVTGLSDAFIPARKAYQKAGFDRRIESVTYYLDLNAPEA